MTRIFGTQIDPNARPGKELSPETRTAILSLLEDKKSPSEIARRFGVCRATIYNTKRRFLEREDFKSRPRSGRPQRLDDRARRHVVLAARQDPQQTYDMLLENIPEAISRSTCRRVLYTDGVANHPCARRPELTPRVATIRLEWATQYQNWTIEDWQNVIFSDECSVERGDGVTRAWAFRRPHEKWHVDMIQTYSKGHDISQMFWGAIYGNGGRSRLITMERDSTLSRATYTNWSYREALTDGLLPIYEPGMLFQQDNAPIHTAWQAQEWFIEHGVAVLNWPPLSPDLNPIEHLWWRLKRDIFNDYPQLRNMGQSEEDWRQFRRASRAAWNNIPNGLILALISSMPARCAAVIAAEGWQTKY